MGNSLERLKEIEMHIIKSVGIQAYELIELDMLQCSKLYVDMDEYMDSEMERQMMQDMEDEYRQESRAGLKTYDAANR